MTDKEIIERLERATFMPKEIRDAYIAFIKSSVELAQRWEASLTASKKQRDSIVFQIRVGELFERALKIPNEQHAACAYNQIHGLTHELDNAEITESEFLDRANNVLREHEPTIN